MCNAKLINPVHKSKLENVATILQEGFPNLSKIFTDYQLLTDFDAIAKTIDEGRYRSLTKLLGNATILATLDEVFDAPAECREMLDDITVRVDFRDFEGTRISNILHTIRRLRDMFLVVEKMNWIKEQAA